MGPKSDFAVTQYLCGAIGDLHGLWPKDMAI